MGFIGLKGQWKSLVIIGDGEVDREDIIEIKVVEELGNIVPSVSMTVKTVSQTIIKELLNHNDVYILFAPEDESINDNNYFINLQIVKSSIVEQGMGGAVIKVEGTDKDFNTYLFHRQRKSFQNNNYLTVFKEMIAEVCPSISIKTPTSPINSVRTSAGVTTTMTHICHNITTKKSIDELIEHIYNGNSTNDSLYAVACYRDLTNCSATIELIDVYGEYMKIKNAEKGSNKLISIGDADAEGIVMSADTLVGTENNSGFMEAQGGMGKKVAEYNAHTNKYSETSVDVNAKILDDNGGGTLASVPGYGTLTDSSILNFSDFKFLNLNCSHLYNRGKAVQLKNSYKFSNFQVWFSFTNKFPNIKIGDSVTLQFPKINKGEESDDVDFFSGVWVVQKIIRGIINNIFSVSVICTRPIINVG